MSRQLLRTMALAGAIAATFACALPARAQSNATPPAATEKPEKAKHRQFTGVIESISAKSNTVVVKHKDDSKTFTISDETKYSTDEKKDAALADFKVGEKVTVHYTEEGGALVAHRITTPRKPKSE